MTGHNLRFVSLKPAECAKIFYFIFLYADFDFIVKVVLLAGRRGAEAEGWGCPTVSVFSRKVLEAIVFPPVPHAAATAARALPPNCETLLWLPTGSWILANN